jgi:hypothetical protein
MKTIAKQLNIKTFPFIIKDDDGKNIYHEDYNGFWAKMEYAGGKMIRYEDCIGRIVDYRPKTDIQKAIDLLTKEGLLTDGKILKN